jgi:hypothetical protein
LAKQILGRQTSLGLKLAPLDQAWLNRAMKFPRRLAAARVLCLALGGVCAILFAQGKPGDAGVFEGESEVGAVKLKGAARFDLESGKYTVSGGGENMWSTNDAFHFVWKRVSGDVALAADIAFSGTNGAPHRKACLMIRQSLDANSAYADAAVHGSGLTSLQYRSSPGAITKQVESKANMPGRVKIEKRGQTVTMAISRPGEDSLQVEGSVQLDLKDPYYVGLAVCAHDNNAVATVAFSKVVLK